MSSVQAKPSQAKPSQAKPSQAKPSQAKPSQAKPSRAKPSCAHSDCLCEQVLGHRADRAASKVLKADMAVPKKAGGGNALNLKGVSGIMRNLNVRDRH